jgi:glycosyltransferase involved in cell wall biosynthesis
MFIGKRRIKKALLQIPSGPWRFFPGASEQTRLLAVTMVRDEARFLPGLLSNITPQVDGIIALDDGSRDGSDHLLKNCPRVLQLLRNRPNRPAYDEPGGLQRLVAAALDHGAEWIMAIDADERLERDFRIRAERVIRRGRRLGLRAFQVHVRELWDAPDRYRTDGIWGLKWSTRLFRAQPNHRFDPRPLHGAKAPQQGKVFGIFPLADLILYHLRMVSRQDRETRRRRYEALDPQALCQREIGYSYLTDERGLRLHPVPGRRGFAE